MTQETAAHVDEPDISGKAVSRNPLVNQQYISKEITQKTTPYPDQANTADWGGVCAEMRWRPTCQSKSADCSSERSR